MAAARGKEKIVFCGPRVRERGDIRRKTKRGDPNTTITTVLRKKKKKKRARREGGGSAREGDGRGGECGGGEGRRTK